MERLRRKGRVDEALALLATLSGEAPDDGRVALEWGRTLLGWAGAPEAARVQLDRALALSPGLHSALLERSLLALRLEDPATALAGFDRLLGTGFRQRVLLHQHRAQALESLGRLEDAHAAWTGALGEAGPNAWLLLRRARLAIRRGRLELAEDDLDAALEAAREAGEYVDPELLIARGEVRRARGDAAGALADAEAALAALLPEETALREQALALRARPR